MEIKHWTYEEFPEFTDAIDGVQVIDTTGDEVGISYLHDVEYANVDGTPLHLQLLIPSCRNNGFNFMGEQTWALPCFVFVQGSAWMKQYVYGNVPEIAKLARKGYVCAIVEYRHSEIAPFPAQAVDTRNAIRYLRQKAKRFGIDPERMVVAGDSSGGHTAMWAGLRHNDDDPKENLFPGVSAEVKGIVNYYGSVSVMLEDGNPSTINHHLPDSPEGLEMGGVNLREHPELCRALSVEENIDKDTDVAPVLMFHGTKDRTVNTKESVLLYNALKAADKDVTFYLVKGADHGGPEFWTEQILDIVDSFMKKVFA